MSQDTDKLLFALLNFGICAPIFGIALCRLNSMGGAVIYRVRSEYAFYVGAAFASAFQPLWDEWPRWGSLAMAAALLLGLLCSGHAWRKDKPPSTATEPAALSDIPEIRQ